MAVPTHQEARATITCEREQSVIRAFPLPPPSSPSSGQSVADDVITPKRPPKPDEATERE